MPYSSPIVPLPKTADVAAFLGWPYDDEETIAPHLAAVTAYVRSHVGGRTFVGFSCAEDIATVILAATARSVANPTHSARIEVGSYSEVLSQLVGFTLLEQVTLNRYRRRTA